MAHQPWSFPGTEALPRSAELPDPFLKPDGSRVSGVAEWPAQREHLKAMLAHYMYGHMPPAPGNTQGKVLFSRPVYGGRAVAETVEITAGPGEGVRFTADLIRPNREGRVPVITWNQFRGRHGAPIEEELVCQRGYAVMEFEKEQLATDGPAALDGPLARAYPDCDWGAIAMWAWGQSRLVDYLLATDFADSGKIVATGHSRGGKVALCAAIYDERIALCAASGSGCGGAGCFRYLGSRLGEGTGVCETAGSMEDRFPFWWADPFGGFGSRNLAYTRSSCRAMDLSPAARPSLDPQKLGKLGDEDRMPFDLHTAKALIAPRPLITTDGLDDTWANPFGTQVTWRAAQEVYEFLGVPDRNALHFRDGRHEYQATDWHAVVDFCDAMFFGTERETNIVRFPAADRGLDPMDWKHTKLHYSWSRPVGEGS